MMRASMLEQYGQDYVITARAKRRYRTAHYLFMFAMRFYLLSQWRGYKLER